LATVNVNPNKICMRIALALAQAPSNKYALSVVRLVVIINRLVFVPAAQ
jgi:hypothetical protein